jgi:hypothetical protein
MVGTHDTALLLYQDTSEAATGKPNRSVSQCQERKNQLKALLPNQYVNFHPKPINRTTITESFQVAKNI